MLTDAEIAEREQVGLNALKDHSLHPMDYQPELIRRAILGSPGQRLHTHEISHALRIRFKYFVMQKPSWPVSGIIIFFDVFQRILLTLIHAHDLLLHLYSISS